MEENARFKVVLSKEARLFLKGLSSKISDKITYNIRKATSVIDPVLFKKLDDTDIWEFRTQYGGIQYLKSATPFPKCYLQEKWTFDS